MLKLPYPAGSVKVDALFRRQRQMRRIRSYFYGMQNELCPYSLSLAFRDFTIKKIGDGQVAPTSALPIGESRKVDETRMVTVEPTNALVHSILAVSGADQESQVIDSAVLGFLWVTEVDEQKQKMTVLSPLPSKIPKSFLVLGMIKWIEK